jgi:hypothetical protein
MMKPIYKKGEGEYGRVMEEGVIKVQYRHVWK